MEDVFSVFTSVKYFKIVITDLNSTAKFSLIWHMLINRVMTIEILNFILI